MTFISEEIKPVAKAIIELPFSESSVSQLENSALLEGFMVDLKTFLSLAA